jgi:chlorophyll(ide) b reductase
VAALGDFAADKLGTVHLWVNNAGAVTGKRLLDETPAEEISAAVGTNVLGSLLCCR